MSKEILPNDSAAFQEAMKNVRPLQQKPCVTFIKKIKLPKKTQAEKPAQLIDATRIASTEIVATDILDFHRGGLQKRRLRQLRQGQILCQAELDLHGLTIKQAAQVLSNFINYALSHHFRCVRIIHGKGTLAAAPRLKNQVNFWLREIPEVIAFHSAPSNLGGTGAVMVLLKLRN